MQVRAGPQRKRPKVLDSLRQDRRGPAWGQARWTDRATPPGPRARDAFRPSWARPLRHAPDWVRDTWAVTPVIGTVMVLAISVIGIAAVLTWGIPNIQQTQTTTEMEGVVEAFSAFDQIAEQVMRGGAVGKASEGRLTIPSGSIQLDDGNLMVVTWSPHHGDFVNTERFWIKGLDDEDPQSFTVQTLDTTNSEDMFVKVARASLTDVDYLSFGAGTPDTITPPGAGYGAGNDQVHVTLGEDVYDRPTKIEVHRYYNGDPSDPRLVMGTWIFPMGALTYSRASSIGTVNVVLENSAVITETDGGDFMRSDPLVTVERDAFNEPRFVALFPLLFNEDPLYPALQGAGSGEYPILFGLAGNTLRANGDDVVAVQIKVVGDRSALWLDHFKGRYKFTDMAPADASVRLSSATPFDLVIMESTIELALKVETVAIST